MARDAYARGSLTQVVRDAWEQRDRFDARSTKFWDRTQTLVRAMRTGDDALGVPPYNGDLFAPDGFEGAEVLEEASLPDTALGPALVALGIEPDTGLGYDFSGLEIGHLGHIYEGLLSLRLSVADRDYRYDARRDRYVPADAGRSRIVDVGELLWLTDEGGRKGGGVYYTPEALVRHLVRRGVLPAFERHLEKVAALAREDPAKAARKLFAFRVLDPACGSAHFLVAVVDELADLIARFLGEHPLPQVARELDDLRAGAGATYGIGVEDVALLRRLVLRRCVYGVDLSPMGAEIAKISLWLASFVPGLSLAYLDHNVRVGNSLIGVASADQLLDASGGTTIPAMLVMEQMERAAIAAEVDGSSKPSIRIPHSSFIVKSIGPSIRSRPRSRSQPVAASISAPPTSGSSIGVEEPEHAVVAALELVPAVVDVGADPADGLAVALGRGRTRPRRARTRGSCARSRNWRRSKRSGGTHWGSSRRSRYGTSMNALRSRLPATGRIARCCHRGEPTLPAHERDRPRAGRRVREGPHARPPRAARARQAERPAALLPGDDLAGRPGGRDGGARDDHARLQQLPRPDRRRAGQAGGPRRARDLRHRAHRLAAAQRHHAAPPRARARAGRVDGHRGGDRLHHRPPGQRRLHRDDPRARATR